MNEDVTSVEKTVRYATSVEDLPSAWAFVMEYLEMVGSDPTVLIEPFWVISTGDEKNPPRRFSVVVHGTVKE